METKVIRLRPKYQHEEPMEIVFEVGNVYAMQFIGDSDLKPKWICTKRTPKRVTFERWQDPYESITRKINVYDRGNGKSVEYIREGSYSMAPTIYSDKIVG